MDPRNYANNAANTGYAGAGNAIGQAQPTADTIGSIVDEFDGEISHLTAILENVRSLADRIHGSQPREIGGIGKAPAPESNALLLRLKSRRETIGHLSQAIDSELNRLGNGL